MRFDFTFDLDIAGETVAQLDGYAVLGKQTGEAWRVLAIYLERFPSGAVEIPRDHFLRTQIELWLHKAHGAAIAEAWGKHRSEQKAEAAA